MNPIPTQRFPREQAAEAKTPLLQMGWSDWVKAIVPQAAQQPGFYIQGPNGFRWESQEAANGCGIFEWQARKIENWNETKIVVYIGSTCQVYKGSSLRDRITEYCTNGSSKADLINDALTKGYELWVRVKSSPDKETAEDLENELLDRYDYE